MASLSRSFTLYSNPASSIRNYTFRFLIFNPLRRSSSCKFLSIRFNHFSSIKHDSKVHFFSTKRDSVDDEIVHEFRFFRVFKTGRIEKFRTTDKIPPSDDPITGVRSKDVVISTNPPVSARIFLPHIHNPNRKLPILLYIHGGGFSFESAFSPCFHSHVTSIASKADVIAVSVEYGLFPERPIPACYEDSWAALQWIESHANGSGPEKWLTDHGDFDRVFIAGDSAGGNISHTLAVRAGKIGLPSMKVEGVVLVHPYFGGTDDDKMWLYMCQNNSGLDDPRLKPDVEDLRKIGCERMLIFVAENDHLSEVGRDYYEELKKSGWKGSIEIVENEGVDHCFHVHDSTCNEAVHLMNKFVSFINKS